MNEDEIRAAEAHQLLENPRLNEAFHNIRERLVARLESTEFGDTEQRLELVIGLQILKAIRSDIEDDIIGYNMRQQPNDLGDVPPQP